MRKWQRREVSDKTAKEALMYLVRTLTAYLEDLNFNAKTPFAHGEKTAFVECLEMIQKYYGATELGLDYDVEARFPI